MHPFHWKKRVFLVGLTGAPGSGKSTVRQIFEDEGIATLDADASARTVFDEENVQKEMILVFGEQVLDHGRVSRQKIADLVFLNQEAKQKLEAIIHPAVRKIFLDKVASLQDGSIFVYDVPLLFETGMEKEFDATVFISSSFEERKKRVEKRSGWTEEELRRRDASQLPVSQKEKMADTVIVNNGDWNSLKREVHTLIEGIRNSRGNL